MSKLSLLFSRLYGALCGEHPNQRLWHFQWLSARMIHRDLRSILPTLSGRILDVGCGYAPYRKWLNEEHCSYVGLDIDGGDNVADIRVLSDVAWPIEKESIDVVICTQVIEHVNDLDFVMHELRKVLKPGGLLIVSVPFSYNEHGAPFDFRRLSVFGVMELLKKDFELQTILREGAVGSVIGIWLLNWVWISLSMNSLTKAFKFLGLPLLICISFVINLMATLLDRLDRTNAFYGNVLAIGKKRTE